jgi:hypothetical protein
MKAKEEQTALSKLIDKAPENMNQHIADKIPELHTEPVMDIDFGELKNTCDNEAKLMIINSVSFSLPVDMIEGNEYLKNKIEVDALSLSGMLYQLRCNEAMQKAIMEEVNRGALHPRMFEVFSGMSKTIGDLNKQLLQTVEAIRSTYKGIKQDMHEKRTEAMGPRTEMNGIQNTGDGGMVAYGSKELIKEAKRRGQEAIEASRIINPDNDVAPEFIEIQPIPPLPTLDNYNKY